MKQLPKYNISEELFYKVLSGLKKYVQYTDNINAYFYGYPNKKTIYTDNHSLIIKALYLNHFLPDDCKIDYSMCWKQIIVTCAPGKQITIQKDVNGCYAYNYMAKILKKYYSETELKEILTSYKTEYDKDLIQYHKSFALRGKLRKFENCYKFDINSAYGDTLRDIFPKAAKDIEALYNTRKEKPQNKAYLNYFIGYLKHLGYVGIYNYIVQKISKRLQSDIQSIRSKDSLLLYANTDGFIISNPAKLLETSNKLGDYKLEYQGDVYIYCDKNYICYQYGDEILGSVRTAVRDKIDLRKGQVVHYDIVRNKDDKGVITEDIVNIEMENIYGK